MIHAWAFTCSLYTLATTIASSIILFTTTDSTISSIGQQVSVPCYQVTFPLPEVSYLPEELVIISSLIPNDIEPMINNFTDSSSQHTTTYCNLSPGVEYSYTIRIVLQSNTSVDIADPVTGSFTLSEWVGVFLIMCRFIKYPKHFSNQMFYVVTSDVLC